MNQPTETGDNRRTVIVRVRVTLTEKKRLLETAAEAGLNLSDWIRGKAIETKPLLRKPSPDRELLLRFLAAFGKTSSNLNQVARQLNRKQGNEEFAIPTRLIVFLLNELKDISTQLRKLLGNAHHNGKN